MPLVVVVAGAVVTVLTWLVSRHSAIRGGLPPELRVQESSVPQPRTGELDPKRAQQLVDAVRDAEGREAAELAADDALNFLLKQLEALRPLANDYPKRAINMSVFMDGRDLTRVCDQLTTALADRGMARQQELASRLASGCACQVIAHYPEEIFPRVLRNARCCEAIDQVDRAIGLYQAIVSDFIQLQLGDILDEPTPLDPTEKVILEAVRDAVQRLSELHPEIAEPHRGLLSHVLDRLKDAQPAAEAS